MFNYIIDKVFSIHKQLIQEDPITQQYLNEQIYKTIFDKNLNPNTFKNMYNFTFYFIANTIGLIKNFNNPVHKQNLEYIKSIVKTNQIESIENQTTYTSRSFFLNSKIVRTNPFMKEIIEKTEAVTNNDSDGYYSLTKYVGGVCWLNAKLSNGFELLDDEVKLLNSINGVIDKVEPLSYPISLFHGFEYYTKYSDYKVGDIVNVGGFLSKTISYNIALSFAQSQNLLNPKFLIVNYPSGTKHVHHDIRPFNNEFEFLTKSNEKLKVINIIDFYQLKKYSFIPMHLTFYICEPIN